jgi:hypothetical protein
MVRPHSMPARMTRRFCPIKNGTEARAATPNRANANSDAGWWHGGWKHSPSRYLTL